MAMYKYAAILTQSNDAAFDTIHPPGTKTPFAGIYRCEGCAVEIVSEYGNPLPPTHAQMAQGHQIRWRLVVARA